MDVRDLTLPRRARAPDATRVGSRVNTSMNRSGWPAEIRDQIRRATDIVDLVGSHLQLVRRGHLHLALCPWHEDTRPSLQVDERRQTYKCWVCDKGGDVFSFVMEREGLSFPEAMRVLADRAGIVLPQGAHGGGDADSRKPLYAILDFAAREFHRHLLTAPDATAAREYLRQRGIDDSSLERFCVGYAPAAWSWFRDRAKAEGFDESQLEQAGMLARSANADRTYDRFRDRVMFPIRDPRGAVIAFGGRVLPGAPPDTAKYVNSPETRLFTKNQQLYALDIARDHVGSDRTLAVMEGYTDVIMAHQAGVKNVVAVLGTALGVKHTQLLRRYADRVVLVLDGDEAGRRRTNEVLELFMQSPLDLRVCTLPDQMDPCDFVVRNGAEALRTALAASTDALSHKIRQLTERVDLRRDAHAANEALEDLIRLVAKIPAGSLLDDGRFQLRVRQVMGVMAQVFQLPLEALQSRLTQVRRTTTSGAMAATGDAAPAEKICGVDRDVLGIMARHGQIAGDIVRAITAEDLVSSAARRIFSAFCQVAEEHPEIEFHAVLGLLEDVELKGLLVDIDDLAGRNDRILNTPRELFAEIFASIQDRASAHAARRELGRLTSDVLDEGEQLRAVELILAQQRSRQGISADHPRTGDPS